MRRIITTAAVGVFAAAATLTSAQDAKTDLPFELPAGMTQEQFEACAIAAAPSASHERLTRNAGEWRGTGTMWMTPGAEPLPITQTLTFTVIMDGRFLKGEFEGDMGGMPFVGMGLYGYDNVAQRYEATMIGSCSTGTMRGVGELSSDGSTITWHYEYHCPMTGGPTTMRETERQVDADTIIYHTYMPDPATGREFKMAEFTFKRVKGGAVSAR